jgi:hypothetical protein
MDSKYREAGGAAPTRALRLTFSYSSKDIHLDEIQPLEEMASPPTDPIQHGPEAGFWYELRDAKNATLYRQVVDNPMRHEVEVYTEGAPINRLPKENHAGSFTLLAPSLEGVTTIALFSSPLDPATFGAAAIEIARFSLVDREGGALMPPRASDRD